MASLIEFLASIADVANEQRQNIAGLVQSYDFNADVVVRFLRDKGIEASVDETTGDFRYAATDPTRASNVRFSCVWLRASISNAIEAAYSSRRSDDTQALARSSAEALTLCWHDR